MVADLIEVGSDILMSEDLTDQATKVFLTLMAERFSSDNSAMMFQMQDIASVMKHGVYVPCVSRIAYSKCVDQRSDGLPDFASMVDTHGGGLTIWTTRRLDVVPKEMRRTLASAMPGKTYKLCRWSSDPIGAKPAWSGIGDPKSNLYFTDHYVNVAPDDRVFHWHHKQINPVWNVGHNIYFCATMNIWNDRRYIWNVETSETVLQQNAPTPLIMGVSPEHIKSLFYAREMPLTETGRKRPILHWVRAHERRLKSGTEVDIAKHLRGITGFSMHGFDFKITRPIKAAVAAEKR